MKTEPTLIVMAAGMGSRYGGLKQMDPITSEGEIIIDFSLYDAMMAGFKRVIFVIKEEMEQDFRGLIDDKAGKHLKTEYAFQSLSDIPQGYKVPEDRVKPWGTAHAIMSCRKLIDGPFAVINADDFYGADAFQIMYEFLQDAKDDEKARYAMVGYQLEKTLTENGHVARGVCTVDENGYLENIVERTKIMHRDEQIMYTEDEKEWHAVNGKSTVSMNFWGFTHSMMTAIEDGFPPFLDETMEKNPLKGEYLLPEVADTLLKLGKATVKVLDTDDRWYGVTYKEDKPYVMDSLQSLKDKGLYPEKLWR